MIFKRIAFFLLLLLASSPIALGQSSRGGASGSITGTVKDSSGAVLPGAGVTLQPGSKSVVSNRQGDFFLPDVAPGTYTLKTTYIGFADLSSTVTVSAGQVLTVSPVMSVNSDQQKVDVVANLTGDAEAINEQRTSENILNVETDVQIQSLPNQNVADALGRLPGVTLQRNEGEGQYVQIRGTEPRLSNTTIDGVVVPGPDPQVRQVDLDTIPAGIVGSVAINKTLSANQDGDAIGGSVDVRIKQATSDRPTFSVTGTGGNTPIDNQRQSFSIGSVGGFRFGPRNESGNRKIGLEMGYSYDSNQRGIDDVEPTPDLDANGNETYDGENIQEYLYDRTRYGFAGALDYNVSPNSSLYAHGLFSNFRDYGQKYAYKLNGQNAKFSTSVRRPNLQIAELALGGNHVFTNSFVKYQVAIAHSRFGGAAGNPGADFKLVPNSNLDNLTSCSYSATASISPYRPQFTGCTTPGSSIYDPTQYNLVDINTTTGQATQLNLQASGSYGRNFHLGTHNSAFELGAQVRNEHKGQDAYSPTYDNFVAPANQPNATAPSMSQFLSPFTNPKFYGGSYQLGPVTNFDSIIAYLNANPAIFPLDEEATHQGSDASNYNLQERVTAGYIMNTLQLGSKFHLQTGLRIEATSTSNTGYVVLSNADGSYGGTVAQHGSDSYINPLPSVQLRYTIDNSSDVRAVYGRGISRPDPYQLVPYLIYSIGGAVSGNDLVQVGNPALVAEHANDFDVLYEKYLPSVGMLEAGYFYKQITKPIYLQQRLVPTAGQPYTIPGTTTPEALQQQEVNGDHAYVQGLELAYQQHLKFLPGSLGNVRIDANFTYTNSKNYNLAGRTDTPQLVGQAPYSWNIGPSYATKRALVSIGVSHNSANIYAYQFVNSGDALTQNAPTCITNIASGSTAFNTPSSPCGDNYFYSHTQIDAQASYDIGKGFTILASGLNMNNEVFGFYNGSPRYDVQREYYKPTYSGGIRWNLNHSR